MPLRLTFGYDKEDLQHSPAAWVEAFSAALLRSITALSEARCAETAIAQRGS
jgi:hypothetical protein